jgi:maleamate amidohydrolase
VRAGVVDAFSQNYRVTVVEECTFDRFECSHAVNLLDLHCKYGDVLGIDEVTAHLRSLDRGLFADKIAFPKAPPLAV